MRRLQIYQGENKLETLIFFSFL